MCLVVANSFVLLCSSHNGIARNDFAIEIGA